MCPRIRSSIIEEWCKTLLVIERRNPEGAVLACETSLRVRNSIRVGHRTHSGLIAGERAGVEQDSKI